MVLLKLKGCWLTFVTCWIEFGAKLTRLTWPFWFKKWAGLIGLLTILVWEDEFFMKTSLTWEPTWEGHVISAGLVLLWIWVGDILATLAFWPPRWMMLLLFYFRKWLFSREDLILWLSLIPRITFCLELGLIDTLLTSDLAPKLLSETDLLRIWFLYFSVRSSVILFCSWFQGYTLSNLLLSSTAWLFTLLWYAWVILFITWLGELGFRTCLISFCEPVNCLNLSKTGSTLGSNSVYWLDLGTWLL